MTFTAPAPGSWLMAGPAALRIANHESAHAVVAVVRGIEVRSARIDGPDLNTAGVVQVAPDLTRLFDHLLAILAGPIASGTPLEWKPNPNASGDEGAAALVADKLGLDAVTWLLARCTVEATLRDSRAALVAVGRSLLQHGALPGAEVHRIVEECGLGGEGPSNKPAPPPPPVTAGGQLSLPDEPK